MRKFIKLTAALCAVFLLSLCLFSTVAYAAPEDETADPPAETVTESVPPAETVPEDDFIIGTLPPGTGTVVDAFTDEDGRKFYTIQTPAGNTFYLIIDFTKQGENVYFLDAVQEKDLLALAEKAANPNGANANPGANVNSNPAPTTPGNQTEPEPKESDGNNMFSMILVVLVVVIGGGAGIYFKVIKKKQNNDKRDEYEDEDEYIPDGPDDYEEPEDDSPPWEDEDV